MDKCLLLVPISKETRSYFEEYVLTHLNRRALAGSIHRQRIFTCSTCETPFSDLQIMRRIELGFSSIMCSVCETEVPLLDDDDRLLIRAKESVIPMMNRIADSQRDLTTAAFILQSKIEINDFDVFLCYSKEDRREVKKIGEQLKEKGVLPWLDEWELRPGLPSGKNGTKKCHHPITAPATYHSASASFLNARHRWQPVCDR